MFTRGPASTRLATGAAGAVGILALAGCNLGAPGVTYELDGGSGFPIDPYEMASGDVDGDGDVDIVAGGSGGHAVLFNDGDGTFTTDVRNDFDTRFTTLADVTGDGHLDLVASLSPGSGGVPAYRPGDGTGDFGQPVTLEPLGSAPDNSALDLVAADVDGDDDVDVLTTTTGDTGGRHVAVYRNDGTGTFAPRVTHDLGFSTDTVWPVWLDTGDVDGDGDVDLVATTTQHVDEPISRDVTMAVVALNDGTGAYAPTAGPVQVGGLGILGVWPLQPAFGDLDGDDDLDIAVGGSGAVTTLLGDGAGGFAAPVRHPVGVSGNIDFVAPADVDGDGQLDLVGSHGPGTAVVAYGDGAGGVEAFHAVDTGTAGQLDRDVLATDLDGDGDPDIAVAGQSGIVGVLENVDGRPEH